MPLIQYRQALNQALREEMRRDETVFVIGEDIAEYQGAYRVTENLLQEFGDNRVRDTPISEEAIVGVGVGAAMVGLRPIIELMTINFSLLAIDQIVNHAAKIHYMSGGQFNIPLVIRCPEGAGMQLGAQHSQLLEVWFAHVPGLIVVAPGTPKDAKGLLKASIRNNNPVIFVEHQLLYTTKGEVPEDDYITPIGEAEVKREGTDITILTYLRMVGISLKAADQLAEEGISVEVVDLRTLRPLDIETMIKSVKKTHKVVIVEENWPQYGVGAQLVDQVQHHAFDYLDAPVQRVTMEDTPSPYSRELELSALPDEHKVAAAVKRVMGKKSSPA